VAVVFCANVIVLPESTGAIPPLKISEANAFVPTTCDLTTLSKVARGTALTSVIPAVLNAAFVGANTVYLPGLLKVATKFNRVKAENRKEKVVSFATMLEIDELGRGGVSGRSMTCNNPLEVVKSVVPILNPLIYLPF
jgi:hypothetical protein